MNFGKAFVSYWGNYAKFDGRASRSEFWFAALANGLIGLVVVVSSVSFDANGLPSYGPLYWIWLLATLLPSLAIYSRRLHDTNRSFTNYWLTLIPIVGAIILLVYVCQPSTPGSNKYGELVR